MFRTEGQHLTYNRNNLRLHKSFKTFQLLLNVLLIVENPSKLSLVL